MSAHENYALLRGKPSTFADSAHAGRQYIAPRPNEITHFLHRDAWSMRTPRFSPAPAVFISEISLAFYRNVTASCRTPRSQPEIPGDGHNGVSLILPRPSWEMRSS